MRAVPGGITGVGDRAGPGRAQAARAASAIATARGRSIGPRFTPPGDRLEKAPPVQYSRRMAILRTPASVMGPAGATVGGLVGGASVVARDLFRR